MASTCEDSDRGSGSRAGVAPPIAEFRATFDATSRLHVSTARGPTVAAPEQQDPTPLPDGERSDAEGVLADDDDAALPQVVLEGRQVGQKDASKVLGPTVGDAPDEHDRGTRFVRRREQRPEVGIGTDQDAVVILSSTEHDLVSRGTQPERTDMHHVPTR